MRTRRAAIFALAFSSLLLAGQTGIAYRFYGTWNQFRSPSARWAARWDESALPAKFRLLENDLVPRKWSRRFLRSAIEEAFTRWNSIPTSTFRVELEDEPLIADRHGHYGVSEIGFSAELRTWHAVARAELFDSPSGIRECNIPLTPGRWDASEDAIRPWLLYVVMHELGHCLGLVHSEQYPVSDWFPEAPSGFSPPPLMAYAWTAQPVLAEDDRVGASLLYPTPAFTRSRGAIGGRVVVDDQPAGYVYVQAFRAGVPPQAGPGAFADAGGEFLLEGLRPGPTLLWMHPVLVTSARSPHGLGDRVSASEGRTAVQDQWRWVTVRAGATTIVPDFVAATGRRAEPP